MANPKERRRFKPREKISLLSKREGGGGVLERKPLRKIGEMTFLTIMMSPNNPSCSLRGYLFGKEKGVFRRLEVGFPKEFREE